jgi:hypothetical protein
MMYPRATESRSNANMSKARRCGLVTIMKRLMPVRQFMPYSKCNLHATIAPGIWAGIYRYFRPKQDLQERRCAGEVTLKWHCALELAPCT